jgi:hypothetical protein
LAKVYDFEAEKYYSVKFITKILNVVKIVAIMKNILII